VPILIGHSHGGSLIAHALANDERLCVLLLTLAGWMESQNSLIDAVAISVPFLGLFAWWATYQAVGRFLGVSDGLVTERTRRKLADLVNQLDLSPLEARGVNQRALVIRSTADEAASGLAAAQLAGRIASDAPSLAWKLPAWGWGTLRRWLGFDGKEHPPGESAEFRNAEHAGFAE